MPPNNQINQGHPINKFRYVHIAAKIEVKFISTKIFGGRIVFFGL
jgi:hypothetical protein